MTTHKQETEEISWKQIGRKLFHVLCGMPFSFLLLGLIMAACIAGSVIPQGGTLASFEERYGTQTGHLIFDTGLGDVFHCRWFIVLALLLCFNLILCSIRRLPALIRANRKHKEQYGHGDIGMFGSWITHLGMLLLILGFGFGQVLSTEYTLYGIPGSTQPVGDTGLELTIDSFDVNMREDFTVEQYIAGITVTSAEGEKISGTASVNHPFAAGGYTIYQDSMGWAAYVDIYHDKELMRTDLLCVGEYTWPDDMPQVVFMLNKFYPDFAEDEEQGFYSKTPLLNNPKALYSIYYNGRVINMNHIGLDEAAIVSDYAFILHDPTEYTLLVIRRDPTSKLVALSALILVIGLFISFYLKPMLKQREETV